MTHAQDRLKETICQVGWNGRCNGTGFLIAPNLVLTAYHVIESAPDPVMVHFEDDWLPIKNIQWDSHLDVAVLTLKKKLKRRPLLPGPLPASGDSWQTRGFPQGLGEFPITQGNIEEYDYEPYTVLLHSTKAIGIPNNGFSGAPCLVDGKVVGVVVQAAYGAKKLGSGFLYVTHYAAIHQRFPKLPKTLGYSVTSLPVGEPSLLPYLCDRTEQLQTMEKSFNGQHLYGARPPLDPVKPKTFIVYGENQQCCDKHLEVIHYRHLPNALGCSPPSMPFKPLSLAKGIPAKQLGESIWAQMGLDDKSQKERARALTVMPKMTCLYLLVDHLSNDHLKALARFWDDWPPMARNQCPVLVCWLFLPSWFRQCNKRMKTEWGMRRARKQGPGLVVLPPLDSLIKEDADPWVTNYKSMAKRDLSEGIIEMFDQKPRWTMSEFAKKTRPFFE